MHTPTAHQGGVLLASALAAALTAWPAAAQQSAPTAPPPTPNQPSSDAATRLREVLEHEGIHAKIERTHASLEDVFVVATRKDKNGRE